jgi:phosphomannomutase
MTDTLMVGVSGVRGIVDKDLTPEIVTRWARAFGRWATEQKPVVVVGRDSRQSGPRFARAVHEGLTAAGCDVIDVGLAPTPTIQLAAHRAAAAASPVTGATIENE